MAKLLLGKEVTAAMNGRIRQRVEALRETGTVPCLQIIRVGEDPGDLAYERGAAKRCELLQVQCLTTALPADVTQDELLAVIRTANEDDAVHGVLLLRPLPRHLDANLIENALDPRKDVDCMTEASLLGVFTGVQKGYPPCTPQACMEILDHYGIDCTGKRAVVIGRSLVVGKPAAMMLLGRNATVTVCHTRTADLAACAREADILVAAAGRQGIVGPDFLREGQIVLDVGINTDAQGKLCGDVDPEAAELKAEAFTPVPGGVGSVTTSVLVEHVVDAAEKQWNKNGKEG